MDLLTYLFQIVVSDRLLVVEQSIENLSIDDVGRLLSAIRLEDGGN
jgi:hypothetical protein